MTYHPEAPPDGRSIGNPVTPDRIYIDHGLTGPTAGKQPKLNPRQEVNVVALLPQLFGSITKVFTTTVVLQEVEPRGALPDLRGVPG